MAAARVIARSEEIPERGRGVRFRIAGEEGPLPAFAVRYDGRVYAFINRCTHVSLQLDFMPGHFFDNSGELLICATHGAVYRPETGACAGGPCNGAGLSPVPVAERDGRVELVAHTLAAG